MPEVEGIPRSEFQGFVDRHEDDAFAHAAMRHTLRNELLGDALKVGARLDRLERWQQRLIGAGAMLTFLFGAGIIALIVELARGALR